MTGPNRRTWHVPYQATAVSDIRAAVRKTLADWGISDINDDNALILTELITNAIRHGAPDITLVLHAGNGLVTGAVADQGHGRPHIRPATELSTSGRGLHLVDDLATAWGVEPHPGGGHGKIIWWTWRAAF